MSVHAARPLTAAVISVLQTAGLTVGDADAPAEVSGAGYVVVYPLPGGSFDGSLADAWSDADPVYQLTSVGRSRQQCEWVADKARVTMLAATWTLPDGRKVMRVRPDMSGGTMRDDDTGGPPIWY